MEALLCHKYYIYYMVKALSVKTWGLFSDAHKVYELKKCYYYKSIDEGYEVNSYTLPITNSDGIKCNVVLDKACFDRYFIEIPGTYIETK